MLKSQKIELPQRVSNTARFLADVTYFHVKTGMRYESIGRLALKNQRFWSRMQSGGTITLAKSDQVYDWMRSQGYYFNNQGDCYVEKRD